MINVPTANVYSLVLMILNDLFPYRYKSLSFLSSERRDVVMERVFLLLEEAEEERLKSSQDSQESSSSQGMVNQVKVEPGEPTGTATVTARLGPPKPKKQKSVRSLMDRMQGEVTDLTQPAENLRKEVHEYLGAMVRVNQTPLQWWALHEVTYPNVARLAKEYLSIPPTEVIKLYNMICTILFKLQTLQVQNLVIY